MIQKIESETTLHDAINSLENAQKAEVRLMKGYLGDLYESVQPINLIKHTVQGINASRELKGKLMTIAVGLAVGHLTRLIYQRSSKNPLKKLIGAVLQFRVANIITGKPEAVRKIGAHAIKVIKEVVTNSR